METNELPSREAVTLYAAWYCPFAQRAWMGLLHKGLAFQYIEVDPYRESQWWLDISRGRAKVPVVVTPAGANGRPATVIDSTRVLEYLEDLAPKVNPLFPAWPRTARRRDSGSTTSTNGSCPTCTAFSKRRSPANTGTSPGRS